jgi:hypothetical protein
MVIMLEIDGAVVDELVRLGFLNRRREVYPRDEIKLALEQAIRVWASYE